MTSPIFLAGPHVVHSNSPSDYPKLTSTNSSSSSPSPPSFSPITIFTHFVHYFYSDIFRNTSPSFPEITKSNVFFFLRIHQENVIPLILLITINSFPNPTSLVSPIKAAAAEAAKVSSPGHSIQDPGDLHAGSQFHHDRGKNCFVG